MQKKLRVGFFSFTGCEGDMVVFLELLNDKFPAWSKLLDVKTMRLLQDKDDHKNLDVAFVEGAISSEKELKKIKEIRKNCKRLVAIGSCATDGGPSAQRNLFNEEKLAEVEFIVKKFRQLDKVLAVPKVAITPTYRQN